MSELLPAFINLSGLKSLYLLCQCHQVGTQHKDVSGRTWEGVTGDAAASESAATFTMESCENNRFLLFLPGGRRSHLIRNDVVCSVSGGCFFEFTLNCLSMLSISQSWVETNGRFGAVH